MECLDADLLANLRLLTIVQMCWWADGVGPAFTGIPAVAVVFGCLHDSMELALSFTLMPALLAVSL